MDTLVKAELHVPCLTSGPQECIALGHFSAEGRTARVLAGLGVTCALQDSGNAVRRPHSLLELASAGSPIPALWMPLQTVVTHSHSGRELYSPETQL